MKANSARSDNGAPAAIRSADVGAESADCIGDVVATAPVPNDSLLRGDLAAVLDALLRMTGGK